MQYFLFHGKSNCETNKLITSKLNPRFETYLCEKISFIDIFSGLNSDIFGLNSDISVDVLTSFIPVHAFTGCVIDDAASLYCLPFTYIYT